MKVKSHIRTVTPRKIVFPTHQVVFSVYCSTCYNYDDSKCKCPIIRANGLYCSDYCPDPKKVEEERIMNKGW